MSMMMGPGEDTTQNIFKENFLDALENFHIKTEDEKEWRFYRSLSSAWLTLKAELLRNQKPKKTSQKKHGRFRRAFKALGKTIKKPLTIAAKRHYRRFFGLLTTIQSREGLYDKKQRLIGRFLGRFKQTLSPVTIAQGNKKDLYKKLGFACSLGKYQLHQLLNSSEFMQDGDMGLISSRDSSIGIIKRGDEYYYFDPRDPEDSKPISAEELSQKLFASSVELKGINYLDLSFETYGSDGITMSHVDGSRDTAASYKKLLKSINIDDFEQEQNTASVLAMAAVAGNFEQFEKIFNEAEKTFSLAPICGDLLSYVVESSHENQHIIKMILQEKQWFDEVWKQGGIDAVFRAAILLKDTEVIKIIIDSNIRFDLDKKYLDQTLVELIIENTQDKTEYREVLHKWLIDRLCVDKQGINKLVSLAIREDNMTLLQTFLSRSGDFPCFDKNTFNKIYKFALKVNYGKVVLSLLNGGLAEDLKKSDRSFLLIWAARNGHADVVEKLLQIKELDVNATDKGGNTALMLAAKKGHVDVVEKLLQAKELDINKANKSGDTALVLAVEQDNVDVVQKLLEEKYINLYQYNRRYGNVIGVSERIHKSKSYRVYKKEYDRRLKLIKLACKGDVSGIEKCLKEGVDVNLAYRFGNTALIWAAINGKIEPVKRLLEVEGIDVNAVNYRGDTALMEAIYHRKTEVVK